MSVSSVFSLHNRARHRRRLLLLSSAVLALGASLTLEDSAWAADAASASAAATGDAAASASAAATGDAAASDAASESDPEITVTARHREEKLQNVPIAISVLGTKELDQTDDYSLEQFQHEIPSMQVVNTNPRNSDITIRGLGANSSLAVDGLEYGVGFYLDGVYYGRPGQTEFDLVDLQQVEVLRGPQGTLFGKNTTAGAINITSKAPSFTPEATAELTYGNYNTRQLRASISAGLIPDLAAFRLSVSDSHHDGYLINTYDNSRTDNYDDFSIRGQLLFTPGADLKIRVIGDYSNERQQGPTLSLIDGYFTTFTNGTPIAYNVFQRAALFNYTLPTYGAFAREGDANSPVYANMKSYGVSGQVDYDLGRATVTSITAYRWWDWYPANDADSTGLPIILKGQITDHQRQFSQELRVASNGHHFIDYVAGLYYFWQTVPGLTLTQYGADFAGWNVSPAANNTLGPILANAEADAISVANTKSYAAYGQIDTHFTDALTLTTGLRFTHEDKNGLYDRYQLPGSVAQLSLLPAATVAAFALSPLSFSAVTHNSALSGLATLGYKLTPDLLAYGTYSHGSQSGGLNITAGGVLQPVVAPEKVDNFEVGVKSQLFNHTLTVNVDGFLTNVKDFQANISLVQANGTTLQYISNIPKVQSKGVEGDLAYAPVTWASFSSSLAYTDAKYANYPDAPTAPEQAPVALGGPLSQNLSGVPLSGVSKFAYTLSGDVSQPAFPSVQVYAHADWLHRSSFNSTTTNSIYGIVPAYGLLNARIGLRTDDGRYDIALWAKNLTNKNYYVSRTAQASGLITAAVGDPRTYGVTFRAKL